MLRRLLPGALLLTLVALPSAPNPLSFGADEKPESSPEKPEKPDAGARLMRAKLASATLILEGMTVEDFDAIEKGALRLQAISALDQWRVSDDEEYVQHSKEFRRIVGTIKTQAQKRNLNGVSLGYVEMTMSCVRCHAFLREEGDVRPRRAK